jgi:hypothetical protein
MKRVLYAVIWIVAVVAVLTLCHLCGFEDYGL